MDHQPYEHISKDTLARIYKIVKVSQEIGFKYGNIYSDIDNGDFALFVFSNDNEIVGLGCSPSCYFIEHETNESTEYYLVTNIRELLLNLKEMGLSGYKKGK